MLVVAVILRALNTNQKLTLLWLWQKNDTVLKIKTTLNTLNGNEKVRGPFEWW